MGPRRRASLVAILAPALAACAAAAAGTQPAAEPPLTLARVLEAARSANPALRAARLRAPVALASVGVARERPNPELLYERSKDLPRDTLSVAQLVELPGRRSGRIDVARASARVADAEIAQVEAEAQVEARRAFYELAAAQRRAASGVELVALARRARDAASARLEAGDVSRLDVLQAELALLSAENEAAGEAGARAAAAAELNVLIGREPAAATVVVDEVDAGAPPPVLAAASGTSAAVAVVEQQIAEAQARAALARAERWPDPTVEAGLLHAAEPDFRWGYRFALGFSLPLFTSHAAAVRLEEATVALRRAEREAAVLRARGAVAAAAARAASQRERYVRFRDEVLPRGREVEDMAEESYRAGQMPLAALLQALQAARELRAQGLSAAAAYESALADLEQAIALGAKP